MTQDTEPLCEHQVFIVTLEATGQARIDAAKNGKTCLTVGYLGRDKFDLSEGTIKQKIGWRILYHHLACYGITGPEAMQIKHHLMQHKQVAT